LAALDVLQPVGPRQALGVLVHGLPLTRHRQSLRQRGSLGSLWVGAPAFGYLRDSGCISTKVERRTVGRDRAGLAGGAALVLCTTLRLCRGWALRAARFSASEWRLLLADSSPRHRSSRDNLNGRGTADELPCSASQPEGRRCDRRRGRTSTPSPLPSARNAELGSLPNWERHQVPGAVSATSGSEPAPSRRVTRGVRRPLCRRGVRRPLGRLDCRALSADPFALLLTAAVGVLQHARSHVAAT
jgi:hypothetical protein